MPILQLLLEALLDIGAMTAADAITGSDATRRTHLDVEIDDLVALLDPYQLRVTVTDQARLAVEALELDKTETRAYVREHIRVPLSQIIQSGRIQHGQRVFVGWKNGVHLSVSNRQ